MDGHGCRLVAAVAVPVPPPPIVRRSVPSAHASVYSEIYRASPECHQTRLQLFMRLVLVKQHPDMPVYHWALAQRYNESNPELQEKYCKESIALDNDFGPGYSCVGGVASLRGDTATAVQSF